METQQDSSPEHRDSRPRAAAPEGVPSRAPTTRLLSLDALRGLTILLMLLVNNIGRESDTPVQLTHAGWQGGVHLADFVFPWFIFCVGMAIPYSHASFMAKNLPAWHYDLRVVRRTLVLILLGIAVGSLENGSLVIEVGVLPLIAMAYLAAALLYDLPLHRRLLIASSLLLAYWATLRYLYVPGIGTGVVQEGRNIVHHVNRTYLAPLGLEGLPLVIPASALALIGTAIGDLARQQSIARLTKAGWFAGAGIVLVVLAKLWDISVRFNKPLWTPSFVLLTTGAATVVLTVLYVLIDVHKRQRWAYPLIVFGSNGILAYVLPIAVKSLVLRPLGISTAGWFGVSVFVAAWWVVLWLPYRRRLFFRV